MYTIDCNFGIVPRGRGDKVARRTWNIVEEKKIPLARASWHEFRPYEPDGFFEHFIGRI